MYDEENINGVSIIICCYNSAERLPETIKHIALQKNPADLQWEVVVVDNNSSDKTMVVAKEEWTKHWLNTPFIIVSENQQGLSYARKKGVQTAKYDLLIFCDDDNWLHEDYMITAYELMQSNKNIGLAGGISSAYLEEEEPLWFNKFENVYAVCKQMQYSGIANQRKYLIGAGIVVRTELFKKLDELSFQFLLTGRKGNKPTSGEDAELCMLALFLGYDLYYDERLRFTHYIPANRLQWSYCVKMISKGFAIPQVYFYMYDYCFQQIMAGKEVSFEYTYKRNYKKPLREIKQHFSGIKNFFHSCGMLLFSQPGSKKETDLKAKINRLLFVLKNRRQLKKDFESICNLMERVKKEKDLQIKLSAD